MGGSVPVILWPVIVVAFALLLALSWFLVRHVGLALLMAFSPLPGFALAAFGGERPFSLFSYLPGFIAAGFLAGTIASLAANTSASQAVRRSLGDLWPALLASLVLLVPSIFTDAAAVVSMAGELSAVAVTASAAPFLLFDEEFVARFNRATEIRLREIERLEFLTKSRWGMSIGGGALVFSVLGFFGAQKSIAAIALHPALPAAAVFVFPGAALAVARNVRRALASVLAMVPVVLLTIALADRFALSPIRLLLPLSVSGMPVLLMAASALRFQRNGDNWQIAAQRGMMRFGPTMAVTMAASAAAAFLPALPVRTALIGGVALFLGGIAALILQPALTTMFYTLFPKRVSLEEAFRKR